MSASFNLKMTNESIISTNRRFSWFGAFRQRRSLRKRTARKRPGQIAVRKQMNPAAGIRGQFQ